MATYTPSGGSALAFGLLIEPPTRQTAQTINETIIPGTNNSVVDIVGKPVTKIRGQARINGFAALLTFEGAVGTNGSLVYSEVLAGLSVVFVSLERTKVTPQDIHLCNIEFWIIPP